jgi:type IV pilus assembly protein PilA
MKRFLKLKVVAGGKKGFTLLEMLVVVAILGVLAAIVVPNVIQFMNEGEEEAKQAEYRNLQTVVLVLMADADVHKLDDWYEDVQEWSEIHQVTATDEDGNVYHLDDYLIGEQQSLRQSYDISLMGVVTVHSD